jgi:hypothetical protein
VGKSSAVPDHNIHGVMLHKNHLTLVKFSHADDNDYREVLSCLRRCLSEAEVMQERLRGHKVESKRLDHY